MKPLLIILVGQLAISVAAAAPKPNVVVILSDDMGYSDLGCYGSEIATPHLDRLAANGLRFTQFYNTARCCPTRASLLTGRYPHQAGMGHMTGRDHGPGFPGYRGDLNPATPTIAETLKPAGYRSYVAGKWHVCNSVAPDGPKHAWPLQRGFDRFYGMASGGGSFYDPWTLARDNKLISPYADPEYQPKTYYFTDAITDHAVQYLADHAKNHTEKPFFLYVAFTAAHWPMHALPEDIAKYKGKYDDGYEPIRKARFEKAAKLGLIDPKQGLTPPAEDWAKVANKPREAACMEVYAAMIDRMDQGIGKLVAELKRTGQFDNTLIMFLQDNGGCAELQGRNANKNHPDGPRADKPTLPPLPPKTRPASLVPPQTRDGFPVRQGPNVMPGPADTYVAYGRGWANVSNTPFREYKHWVHEGGISTPLIAHWPQGIAAKGELRHQPGHLIDILTTAADLAGAKADGAEGRSLVPAFVNKPIEREALFWEHEGNRAVRVGDWKAVAKGPDGAWELYDLASDRVESQNLAEKQPERLKELVGKWETWAAKANVIPWVWKPQYSPLSPASGERGRGEGGFRLEPPSPSPQPSPPAKPGGEGAVPGVIINHSPASTKAYIGSPSLAILTSGEYVASHDLFGPGSTRDTTLVFASADKGKTWEKRATIKGQWWSSLFVHRGDLYLMGTSKEYGFAVIRRSKDGGKTWTDPTGADSGLLLGNGMYHCAPVPVVVHGGRVWRAMETYYGPRWGGFKTFMMSAPADADLLKETSWTSSNRLDRDPAWLRGTFNAWLEGNAVVDPDGKLVNVLRVDQPNYNESAAIVRFSDDGTTASFNPVTDFVAFPGGSKKFTIRFDPVSKKYWTLANAVPKQFRLGERRPDQTRNTLALCSSSNLRDWTIARDVLTHSDPARHAFQYADWRFDGPDLIAVVRTAYDEPDGSQAHKAHDANYLTFHRVVRFRE